MSVPPPDDLKDWSKNDLVRELRRVRAVMREHAEQVNPSHSGGNVIDVAGDRHAQSGAIIDARGAVLLDSTDVVLVDRKTGDAPVVMVLRAAVVDPARQAASSGTDDGLEFAAEFKVAMQARVEEHA